MFDDQSKNGLSSIPPNLPLGEPIPLSQGEPDDMFAGAKENFVTSEAVTPATPVRESALSSGVLRPVAPEMAKPEVPRYVVPPASMSGQGMAPEANPAYDLKEPTVARTLITIILGAIVLGALGASGWWAYGYFIVEKPATTVTTSEANTATVNQPTVAEVIPPVVSSNTQTTPEQTATSDVGADMSDQQILFGQPVDTDGDGLDDITEKKIGTNPNNWDTDGDGLSDGDEVLIWRTDPLKADTDGDGFSDGQEVKNGYNPLGSGKLFNAPTSTNK